LPSAALWLYHDKNSCKAPEKPSMCSPVKNRTDTPEPATIIAANQRTPDSDEEVYDIFPLGENGQTPPMPPLGTGIDGLGRPTDECTICHDLRLVDVKEAHLLLAKLHMAIQAARPTPMPDPHGLPGQFIQDPWEPPFYLASQWIVSAIAGCPCC
jgi:hypothetical protein